MIIFYYTFHNFCFFPGFNIRTSDSKKTDLILAAHIACHSSVRTIDHLGELLRNLPNSGKLSELKLHRTKCSKIICKVLAPCMLKELIEDVGDGWYSIIVDESTDTTVVKYMALMIKYLSYSKGKYIIDFLGIIETPVTTHDVLYQAFTSYLVKIGLRVVRLFSLGTDGGPNLCGVAHSLYALLKKYDCPNLHLVKCICHGLDKCASKASKAFPGTLEMLIRESRNWFSHSAVRKLQYENEYKVYSEFPR